jgi:hypothetical protein
MVPASPSTSSGKAAPTGGFVDAFGGRYFRISGAHLLPTFLMNVPSPSDLWLFLASNGSLAAGRTDAELALFPYVTVDKLYDSAGLAGPCTFIRVTGANGGVLWEPFSAHGSRMHSITRDLYKSVEGDRVWFEERNEHLGLVFRYGWSSSEDDGFIRRCELENTTGSALRVQVLDTLRNILPPGIGTRLQSGSSSLAEAYKTAEVVQGTTLAVYALSAAIIDGPTPMECLRAAAVWSAGLPGAEILVSEAQFSAFCDGEPVGAERRRRGLRSAYGLAAEVELAPRGVERWMMVADTGLSQEQVVARRQALVRGGLQKKVLAAADASTQRLRGIVAAADGCQRGGNETATAHHFANVLFNVMRGGIFADGPRLPCRDFAAHVRTHNRPLAGRHAALLAALPETLTRSELLARVSGCSDPSLTRLAMEYLPITFSRRHGDPSRPWNRFRIHVRDENGQRVLAHEGNWRDIFQNWESLCLSFPEFFEAVVAKFLNASTADGYNPYRISHSGIDWEIPEHDNPWSSIGYWGDHQVVYLLKLLEWSDRFHPGRLCADLNEPRYSYANVPYRIMPFEAMRRNPRATIAFDSELNGAILGRAADFGSDARLLGGASGDVLHVNLTEKLLVVVLTRLTNFVPGGGIWMNTQRPEWNDANNALVGCGVSHVTLCYLRRLIAHWRARLLPRQGSAPASVSRAVASLARAVASALDSHRRLLDSEVIGDLDRRSLLDRLAAAGTDYRAALYAQGPGEPSPIGRDEISSLLDTCLAFVDHTVRINRRGDGLYHAYNLLEFTDNPPGLRLQHLAPMLEGQVAALSSSLLSPSEAADLLDALRASPLYSANLHSYLLYPDRELPGFLERNVIPEDRLASSSLLAAMLRAGDKRLVLRDEAGNCRFHPDLVNGDALDAALASVGHDPLWSAAAQAGASKVREVYEGVFHHRAFTGRSGSMFGFEGLGCVYWHMVAKLLLAAQENLQAAKEAGDPAAERLSALYLDIRSGLGFNKSPVDFGAFPTDPYSHTPGHGGAQQPGMTGQVKEEILTRFGELGVRIADGRLAFRPTHLLANEFSPAPGTFSLPAEDGRDSALQVPGDALAFTFCGVPVVYRRGPGQACMRLHGADGAARDVNGTQLDAAASAAVFGRTGAITGIEVLLGSGYAPLSP